jgi:hypothetical protein
VAIKVGENGARSLRQIKKVRRLRDASSKAYAGILLEPMPKWTALSAPSDGQLAELIDEKFRALFVHFGLDPTEAFRFGPGKAAAWADLAWHLAREHVPGFKAAPRKRGAPPIHQEDNVKLAMHVELLKRRDGLSDRKAIERIASRNIVQGSVEALLGRYKRTKKAFAPMRVLFDNIASVKGADVLVGVMEEALGEDVKNTILSPP